MEFESEFFDVGGLGGTTGSTEGTYIGETWSRHQIIQVEKATGLMKLTDSRFQSDAPPGNIVHVSSVLNMAVRTKSDNTAITYETVAPTNTEINIDTIRYAAFGVEDYAANLSRYDIRKLYLPKMAYAIALHLDAQVGAMFSSLTGGTIGAYNTDIDEDLILLAKQTLDEGDIPKTPRYVVVPPRQEIAFRKITRFTSSEFNVAALKGMSGPQADMYIGNIHGFQVYVSNNLTATGTSVDCAAFHKEAMAMIVSKDGEVKEQYELDHFTTKYGRLLIYGKKAIRPTFGVFVKG